MRTLGDKDTKSALVLVLAVLGFVLSPSPASAAEDSGYSGFLPDYSKLQDDPEHSNAKLWVNPAPARSDYRSILVDPVVMHLDSNLVKGGVQPDPKVVNEVLDYFTTALVREFGAFFTVTDKPGDGVLRYRAAITGIDAKGSFGKSPVDFLPVVFVARTATGANQAKAHIFMESVYTDSLTGELIGEVVQSATGGAAAEAKEISLDTVKPVLDEWAKKAATQSHREMGKLQSK